MVTVSWTAAAPPAAWVVIFSVYAGAGCVAGGADSTYFSARNGLSCIRRSSTFESSAGSVAPAAVSISHLFAGLLAACVAGAVVVVATVVGLVADFVEGAATPTGSTFWCRW